MAMPPEPFRNPSWIFERKFGLIEIEPNCSVLLLTAFPPHQLEFKIVTLEKTMKVTLKVSCSAKYVGER